MATGSEASRGLKPFAAAPRPEPMHGASSHPNPRNVASLRSRNQARFSCLISDSSLLLTAERRFAPTTVRYRRISVRYESEQVSAFIGIRKALTCPSSSPPGTSAGVPHSSVPFCRMISWVVETRISGSIGSVPRGAPASATPELRGPPHTRSTLWCPGSSGCGRCSG